VKSGLKVQQAHKVIPDLQGMMVLKEKKVTLVLKEKKVTLVLRDCKDLLVPRADPRDLRVTKVPLGLLVDPLVKRVLRVIKAHRDHRDLQMDPLVNRVLRVIKALRVLLEHLVGLLDLRVIKALSAQLDHRVHRDSQV